MDFEKFKQIYGQLTGKQLIQQGKFLNNVLAGTAATAITAGSVLGLNQLSRIQKKPQVYNQKISQTYNYNQPEIQDIESSEQEQQKIEIPAQRNWIQTITMPFVIQWEGSITDAEGNHVLYDDNVKAKVKRRWDGKGGQAGIDAFIKSCVGKPTIGYGQTDQDIVRRGKISDQTAKTLLIRRLVFLNNYLNSKYTYYKTLNPNQRTALISFSYNLGKDFIQIGTVRMKAHFKAGRLDAMCAQMIDCDNVTQNGELVKVAGLTRRRLSQMKLFRTPFK